jgi:hypothetical protein
MLEAIARNLADRRAPRECTVPQSPGSIVERAIWAATGCFRRGKPIDDPQAREVIGYEIEEVPMLCAASWR